MARRPLSRVVLLSLAILASGATASATGQTAVLSDLEVNEAVNGDVVVFGADLELGPLARVEGDAVAVGGDIRVSGGAVVTRHVVSVFGGARCRATLTSAAGCCRFHLSPRSCSLPARSRRFGQPLDAPLDGRRLAVGDDGPRLSLSNQDAFGAWALPVLGIRVPISA